MFKFDPLILNRPCCQVMSCEPDKYLEVGYLHNEVGVVRQAPPKQSKLEYMRVS